MGCVPHITPTKDILGRLYSTIIQKRVLLYIFEHGNSRRPWNNHELFWISKKVDHLRTKNSVDSWNCTSNWPIIWELYAECMYHKKRYRYFFFSFDFLWPAALCCKTKNSFKSKFAHFDLMFMVCFSSL